MSSQTAFVEFIPAGTNFLVGRNIITLTRVCSLRPKNRIVRGKSIEFLHYNPNGYRTEEILQRQRQLKRKQVNAIVTLNFFF